jgi:hypothetical protein
MGSILEDFKNTWLKVINTPTNFFEQMPVEGGYADPVKFAVISYIIAGTGIVVMALGLGFITLNLEALKVGFFSIIVLPMIGIVSLFLEGILLHIFFKFLGGKGIYESTFRILAYASAPLTLIWAPVVGILACLYMVYLAMRGGVKVHKISTLGSLVSVVTISVLLVSGSVYFFLYKPGTFGEQSVESSNNLYDFTVAVNTDSKLENLTFYLPVPVLMNESELGEKAVFENTGGNKGWNLSMIETEHGKMLKITANELNPELHQEIEVNPPEPGQNKDVPTGEVISFTRGSIDFGVSMEADHIIDTRNALENEPNLSPKYNLKPSDSNLPPLDDETYVEAWNYESMIYADYTASPDAHVEVGISSSGVNEWWRGGWTYNKYREYLGTEFTGEKHGWFTANGEFVEGEGIYD